MDAVVYDKVGKEAKKIRDVLYGIYPQETITDAAIASFDDGADGLSVQKLVANIEPVQDLHGYDHPWPAGGGKNKLEVTATTQTLNGVTFTVNNDGSIGIKRASADTNNAALVVASNVVLTSECKLNCGVVPSWNSNGLAFFARNSANTDIEVSSLDGATLPADTYTIYVRVQYSRNPNLTIYPMIRLSTETDATFAPYSNICPISGWTGANVMRTGTNLFDETANPGKWIDATGAIITSTATSAVSDKIYVNRGITTAKIVCSPGFGTLLIAAYDSDDNLLQREAKAEAYAVTMTIPENAEYIRFAKYTTVDSCCGYLNSADTIHEEFNGFSTISIAFPASAGTVYGGTLDVTNGVLTVDRAIKNLNGSEEWLVNSAVQNLYYTGPTSFIDIKTDGVIISDTFSATSVPAASMVNGQMKISGRNVNFKTSFETLNDWKAELQQKNVQVVYELITPIAYTLTAEQVSGILATLYGTNNIWADTGNIKKLTYRADLGKYIDSHITTAVANALNA